MLKQTIRTAALLALLLMIPRVAEASFNGDWGPWLPEKTFHTLVMSTSSTTLGGGITISAGIYITVSEREAEKERQKKYILDNVHALEFAISLGAGEQIDDLAAIFRLDDEHRMSFGLLVRHHRELLLDMVEPDKLTNERAAGFFKTVQFIASMARTQQGA